MNRSIVVFAVAFALLLAACGGGGQEESNTLDGKKEQLKTLQAQQRQLNQQIQELEAEIVALDPEAQRVNRAVVDTRVLKTTEFKHYVQVQGKVESNRNIVVSPKTGGTLTQILIREGQRVGAGQTLARIDDAVMKSSINEVQTSLDLANIMYEKQKNLWDQEIGTEVQYLTAKNQKESLERRLETLKEQWEMTKIKAPISGTIDEVIPKIGETVAPGMPAIRIVNISDLSLKANLSENYVPYIKRGDAVKIHFPTLNKNMDARVSVVGQSIDPNSRTFKVEVKLPSDPHVKPNMFGELAINDRSYQEVITVPVSVVQNAEEGAFVFVAEQNESGAWVARRRMIETDLSQDNRVLVTDGLKASERLVTLGFKDLSDGQEIEFDIKPEPQTASAE